MHTEKGIMRTEITYSDNKLHRYLLKREWDSKKAKAVVLMTNTTATAGLHTMDYTSLYIINNLIKLDFGSVEILNMVSKSTPKLNTKEDLESLTNEDNMKQILSSCEKCDKFIIAWGKLGENNKKVRSLQNKLLEKLKSFQEKLYMIADDNGEFGFHPLAPQIRFTWHLVKFEIPEKKEDKAEVKDNNNKQDEKSETTESTDTNEIHIDEQTA